MKNKIIICLFAVLFALILMACFNQNEPSTTITTKQETETVSQPEDNIKAMIYAYVNDRKLEIMTAENSSAKAFIDLLAKNDITIEIQDYAGFEKVGQLGTSLPTNDEKITALSGDVILYQGNSITIYYGTNTWKFTRLGKIQNLSAEELKAILGNGSTTVTFSLK